MLTCRELFEFLADYADGELEPAERERFEEHMAVCPHCVEYLDTYRKTIELAAASRQPQDSIPDDVPEDLIRAILASRGPKAGPD